nr:hypothetical protein [Legionella jordanis]
MPEHMDRKLTDEEESLNLIQSQSERAMHYRMLLDEEKYSKEIDGLARTCAHLLTHEQDIDEVIRRMETSMTSSYLQNLKAVDQTIKGYQERKLMTSAHTFYGGKEAGNLTRQITALEKIKREAPSDLMESIVNDVLQYANKKYSLNLDKNFLSMP